MKSIRGLKRLGFGLAAVAAAGVAALAALPLFVRADVVRDAVQTELRTVTGLDLTLRGDVVVSLFPIGSVRFADVTLSSDRDGQPALTAERLRAHLRFLPLLLGRIEVADVALVHPRILVDIDTSGRSNWSVLLDTLTRALQPGADAVERMPFSEVRVTGGTVLINDEKRGISETMEGVELSLAWPAISKSFGATGQFLWRGEKVDASLNIGDFFAALSGARSGVKLRLASSLLKLGFDGHASYRPTLKVEGNLSADSISLRSALRWTGQTPPPGGGLGRFTLKSQTNVVGTTVALSNVNVELDGNAAEGVLTITSDDHAVLQGTLAADSFDATPYISTIRLLGANEREWSSAPIDLGGLSGMQFDLRLSAARVQVGSVKVGRTAAAATLRSGKLGLVIGEAQAFGGVVKGSVNLARSHPGADLQAQVQFADVDLDACLAALFGLRRLEGRGNLQLALNGAGPDVLSLTRTVKGTAVMSAHDGALTGVNVEQLLRRLERRPLSGGNEFRNGRTPFENLTVNAKITDGVATIEDVKLEGASVRLALGGSASIPARDLDLKGTASLLAARDNAPGSFDLPFVVRGPWDDPLMLPDVESLIRRSGAAAPLLDAVRSGRARDAVRSAIEQLTAPRASQPAKPAEQPAATAPSASATSQ
ncbi:MAG: AsmA family protein [Variibacter sp.]